MGTGKNRPLDEDEIDFVERLLEKDRERDRSIREEEREALEAYQKVLNLSLFDTPRDAMKECTEKP